METALRSCRPDPARGGLASLDATQSMLKNIGVCILDDAGSSWRLNGETAMTIGVCILDDADSAVSLFMSPLLVCPIPRPFPS